MALTKVTEELIQGGLGIQWQYTTPTNGSDGSITLCY